ncbi:MAG: ABC transporter permease subunit [Pseudomonadota bacterium]
MEETQSLLQLLSLGAGGWGDELLLGALLTITLALTTLPFGLALGFLVALAKNSDEPSLVANGTIFTTIFRGLPELLTLFLVYYGGQPILQAAWSALGGGYIEISPFVAGVIALSLVLGAFSSEVFLAAMRAIPKGQDEAGAALGLTRFQGLRLIQLPQIIRIALPGLSNLWLVLLKDTSLVSVIALNDLLRQTNIAVGSTKQPFLFYAVACLIYLTLSLVSSIGLTRIETWADKGRRNA